MAIPFTGRKAPKGTAPGHQGRHAEGKQAAEAEAVPTAVPADPGDEAGIAAPAPGAGVTGELAALVPGSPAYELAGVLDASEMPGTEGLRRILDGLRHYDPQARGATLPNPVLRESRPLPALSEPPPAPVPGATVLLSFSRTGPTVVQSLDGLPGRRTASGKPVIHLGDDPRSDGEAFAIGRMSDAWLDGLITVLMEERSARLKARNGSTGAQASLSAPAFTPRREEGAA